MKKLLLMAFAILTVSAFAAEKSTNTVTQVENTNITAVQVQGADVSLGESFMAAFGMSEGTIQGGSSSGSEGGSVSGSTTTQGSAAVTVGVASAAANAASVNAANSTTIVTPYGKY